LFTKDQAYYVGKALTDFGSCKRCVWFNKERSSCQLVLSEGSPTRGAISPDGTCGLWNASYLRRIAYQVAWGEGAGKSGVLPGIVIKGVIMQKRRKLEAQGRIPTFGFQG
jgi:hypothetical protein